jgi:hypothetical protein
VAVASCGLEQARGLEVESRDEYGMQGGCYVRVHSNVVSLGENIQIN